MVRVSDVRPAHYDNAYPEHLIFLIETTVKGHTAVIIVKRKTEMEIIILAFQNFNCNLGYVRQQRLGTHVLDGDRVIWPNVK